jgi:thiamine-phosphate diphosphorylase/hydroxyethylthiazole kinase
MIRSLAVKESKYESFPASEASELLLIVIGCVVVLTGQTDWISDGSCVVKLENGHAMLGDITGSGCMVGTCVAAFCAAACALDAENNADGKLIRGDMLLGAIGG